MSPGGFGCVKWHQLQGGFMSCPACASGKQMSFSAEMMLHSPGRKNLANPGVWLFPKLLVCLDCGVSLFTIPEPKRGLLTSGTPTAEAFAQEESVHDIARSREITPQSEE
jgi:hypothetical protein